jgi:hypothetical protein
VPADQPLEPSVQHACQAPDLAERDLVQSTCLDPHDDTARDTGSVCNVDLAQPAA